MSENNADGKPVVVKDGQRVGGVHENQQAAQQAADEINRKRQLQEQQSGSTPTPPAEVKTNLFG